MFDGHPWRLITIGRHGEYLLSLTEDFDHELIGHPPSFDLNLQEADSTVDPSVLTLDDYNRAEGTFVTSDAVDLPEAGERQPTSQALEELRSCFGCL